MKDTSYLIKANYVIIPLLGLSTLAITFFMTTGFNMNTSLHRLTHLTGNPDAGLLLIIFACFAYITATMSALITWNSTHHNRRFKSIVFFYSSCSLLSILWGYAVHITVETHNDYLMGICGILLFLSSLLLFKSILKRSLLAAMLLIPFCIISFYLALIGYLLITFHT